MRVFYKRICLVLVFLLLAMGTVIIWKSQKQTKQDKLSVPKVQSIPQNKVPKSIETIENELPGIFESIRFSDSVSTTELEWLDALLDELDKYEKDVLPVSESDLYGRVNHWNKILQEVDKERDAQLLAEKNLDQRIEKARRWKKAMDEAWEPMIPLFHDFFGTEPNVLPEPPANASNAEKVVFYNDLLQKMEEDPNYLRSIQPQLTGRSPSQKKGTIHQIQEKFEKSMAEFRTDVQSEITVLHDDLEQQYFDVLVVPDLTQEEFNDFYPDQKSRDVLQRRTSAMRQHIVDEIKDISSFRPTTEKISIVREILLQEFEKGFADSVLKALEQGTEK